MDEQLIKEFKELQEKVTDFNFKYNQNLSLENSNELLNRKLDNINSSFNSNINYYMNELSREINDVKQSQKTCFDNVLKYLEIKFEQSNRFKMTGSTVLKPNDLVIEIDEYIYFINYEDNNRIYIYDRFGNKCNLVEQLKEISAKLILRYGDNILAVDNKTKELFYFDFNSREKITVLSRCIDFICDDNKIYCINDNKLTVLSSHDYNICAEYQLINISFLQNLEYKRKIENYTSIDKIGQILFINYGGANYIIDLGKNIIVYKNNI